MPPDGNTDTFMNESNNISLNHMDELRLSLSILKTKFHIIGITEDKIKTGTDPIVNLEMEGFRPFIYELKLHMATGYFISEILNYKLRDDLKFNFPGNFESTFIEIVNPNKKHIIIGCVYRHPNSLLFISDFTTKFIDPLLSEERQIRFLNG